MKKSRTAPIFVVVLGSLLMLGPVWGLLGTVFGMIGAFQQYGHTSTSSAEALSSNIGLAYGSIVIGLGMLPIGILLFAIGLTWLIRVNRENGLQGGSMPLA